MRYGTQHNVHSKNKKSDFTRAPKNMMELMGNPLNTAQTGEHRPTLEEGYSYEGGEGMVAVGEVGVSKRYGGGRDGMHHKMESRTVYKEAPEPEKVEAPKAEAPAAPAPEPEKDKGPEVNSEKYATAKERVKEFESGQNIYEVDQQMNDAADATAQSETDASYSDRLPPVEEEDYAADFLDGRLSELKSKYNFQAEL